MSLVFRLAEIVDHLRTRWQYRGDGPIVAVHQMARVGSRTVRQAIRDDAPGVRSFHTHYLNPVTLRRMHDVFSRVYERTGRPGLYREHLHAWWLAERIREGAYSDWRIITLVRDPVARTVSAFFRHLPLHHPELGARFLEDPANVPRLIELFRDPDHPEHRFALDWFDDEVRDVFGVDVFDRPFPKDGGGCVYPCEAGQLLVLRTEDLSTAGGQAIGRFLGIRPMELGHSNRSADRRYAAAHRRFMSELRLSPAYLGRMYGSKLACHFYDAGEIAAFRARWAVDA
jgi:hypothetical protein